MKKYGINILLILTISLVGILFAQNFEKVVTKVLTVRGGIAKMPGSTLTVGTDGAGTDVTFYTDTAGEEFLWDASANGLYVDGTDGTDAIQVSDGNVSVYGALKLFNTANTTGDGAVALRVWNNNTGGVDISANDVVVWDEGLHELGADTTAAKPFRLTFTIGGSTFGGLWYTKWTHGGTSDADSVMVTGTDASGTAQIDTLVLTGGTSSVYGTKLFATITSATAAAVSAAGTQELDAIAFMNVKAADGGNNDIAGVATATISDSGGTGVIVINGPVKATVDAGTNNAAPGSWLIGASGGDASVFVAAAGDTFGNGTAGNANSGKIVGYALQSSTVNNQAIWIFVDRF